LKALGLHGDDDARSCKNLVKFGPVTPEITRVESEIFAATQPQFDDRPSSVHCRFEMDWNSTISISVQSFLYIM